MAAWLLALVIAIPASTADTAKVVAQRVAAALEKARPGGKIGVCIQNTADGTAWFARSADVPLKPASVLKLFVSAAALDHLGPDFVFETRAYLSGGELWIDAAGDPGLGDERIEQRAGQGRFGFFDACAAGLREAGVTALSKIVIDDTIFDQEARHPDWPSDQYDAWYQAPIGGLILNNNCLDSRLRVSGGRVELTLTPALPAEFVRNKLRVGEKHAPVVRRDVSGDIFEFSGSVTRGGELGPVAVGRPSVFAGYALRQGLQDRGVSAGPDVVRRTLTPEARARARLLAVHRTSLLDVLWRCNTYSQNLFAEALLKSLAAYERGGARSGQQGSWEAGQSVLRRTIRDLGVDLTDAVLRDGSGLSHANAVTARQIAQLLTVMHTHPSAAAFRASLAEAGEEGTMQRRYKDPRLAGRLLGKTGTIRGVQTLAGYVTRDDGAVLAFAILLNDNGSGGVPLAVCRAMVE